MKHEYMGAYASSVTASEMFRAISSIPMHQSFSGYDPIGSLQSYKLETNDDERAFLKEVKRSEEAIRIAAHLGASLSTKLAGALDAEAIDADQTGDVLRKYILSLVKLLPEVKREQLGKFIVDTKHIEAISF